MVGIAVLCSLVAAAVAGELWFRRWCRRKGRSLEYPSVSPDPLYIVSHPYLPFAYRPGADTPPPRPVKYPLHSNMYAPQLKVNRLGFPGREPGAQKADLLVVCLGASTTLNVVQEGPDGEPFSYPTLLERRLARAFGDRISVEVIPIAMGTWTSTEIVISFILKALDLRPDVILLYHANNDLEAALTHPFKGDYSHFRRNLGEVSPLAEIYKRFWLRLPDFKPSLLFGFAKSWMIRRSVAWLTGIPFPLRFPYRSLRDNLGSLVRVGQVDASRPFCGLEAERRNLECIIHLCRGFGIQLVMSTYAYYAYDASDGLLRKYGEGVERENGIIRQLVHAHGVSWIDMDREMPRDNEHFLDACHLTRKGCELQASLFADEVIDLVEAGLAHGKSESPVRPRPAQSVRTGRAVGEIERRHP